MKAHTSERIALLIDGHNFQCSVRSLQIAVDYSRLLRYFSQFGKIVRANYYTATRRDTGEYNSLKPLLDWLSYNGYKIVTKPSREYIDGEGGRRIKGNMDVELTVDAKDIAAHVDRIILFSGDGDFAYLVESLQRSGVQVTVVSTLRSTPAMMSDDLRRAADQFIEISAIADHIRKADDVRAA